MKPAFTVHWTKPVIGVRLPSRLKRFYRDKAAKAREPGNKSEYRKEYEHSAWIVMISRILNNRKGSLIWNHPESAILTSPYMTRWK